MTAAAAAAVYFAVALTGAAALARRWRGRADGMRPVPVAALWPIVVPLLAVYYAVALAYTLIVVLRGRRPSPGDPGRDEARVFDAPG